MKHVGKNWNNSEYKMTAFLELFVCVGVLFLHLKNIFSLSWNHFRNPVWSNDISDLDGFELLYENCCANTL